MVTITESHLATRSDAPEQGQLVRVRHRLFLVQDIFPHETGDGGVITRVDLECLDDDRLGETLSVLWEREVGAQVLGGDAFPSPSGKWDHPRVYEAFLKAVRWSSSSVLHGAALQSPFRGAIELEPYQLEAASRAVTMPRVNLLIADDVGLGKTIEAGLVLQELLARARIRNCLIVCPASLQRQWREEMAEKFNLEFRLIDRDAVLTLRREYGTHVNPWRSFPRLITSIDFLKRESVLAQFHASLEPTVFSPIDPPRGVARDAWTSWDLLILDEAHNCAPAGRRRYIRDSDRTKMLRQIAPHFQHRLFLTATPHNGYTESFTALLAELDPLRFHRGPDVDPHQVQAVMIRRLKEELAAAEATHRPFPARRVLALEVPESPPEQEAGDLLDRYVRHRAERARGAREAHPVQFALNILKKRFLSCPLAFSRSLETHLDHVTRPGRKPAPAAAPDEALVNQLILRAQEDVEDDARKDALEQEALRESSRFFGLLTAEENDWLEELWTWAEAQALEQDAKLGVLRHWVWKYLRSDEEWNDERLILFTEYRDTLEYLVHHLSGWLGEDRILTLTGGAPMGEREVIKAAFQADPAEHPVRVLVATDAAAEGLNLQRHCRYLIHYEIPWNPNRLEQRNGRIDRHGQKKPEVFVHHFLHANRADSRFLQAVVDKVQQMRQDLGSVAAVIEERVERFMLGERGVEIDRLAPRRTLHDDVRQALWDNQRLKKLRDLVDKARNDLDLHPQTLQDVLDAALKLEGHPGLEPVEDDLAKGGACLRQPPAPWGAAAAAAVKDARGRLLTLVFDPELARDRRDVALVHLDHPLMRRALASFRRNMFSLGLTESERLNRVTYEAAPEGVVPGVLLVASARLLAVGQLGQKLHEELRTLVWRVSDDGLVPSSADLVDMLPALGSFPSIPTALGLRLQRLVDGQFGQLRAALDDMAKSERQRVQTALARRSEEEAAQVRDMIRTRVSEIQGRLRQIHKQLKSTDSAQMRLDLGPEWAADELEQYRTDLRMLERRRDQLKVELEVEPRCIRERYRLRDLRAFPLGLKFVLPVSVIERGTL